MSLHSALAQKTYEISMTHAANVQQYRECLPNHLSKIMLD